MLVFGATLPRIGTRIELKFFVPPLLVTASPLIQVKMLTNPLHVLLSVTKQLSAVSLPMR